MLYGMTKQGGANGIGCVFSLDTTGKGYDDLLDFYGLNGQSPLGSLTLTGNVLYGMTFQGGANGDGSIFSINTNGTGYKLLISFNGTSFPEGENPHGAVTITGDLLFGMTYTGGAVNYGIVFSDSTCIFNLTTTVNSNISCNLNNNGVVTANPNGGIAPYTYLWSDAKSQTKATATGLSAGTYTVSASDGKGCSATASVSITQPLLLRDSTMVTANISCYGESDGSAFATATGGTSPYSYLWNDSKKQSADSATGLSAGKYSVTVTDSNGCTATASVTITQPLNALSIGIATQTNVDCKGNSSGNATASVATGGTSPYIYKWTPIGGTNLTASDLSSGTYTITVTDSRNCTAATTVTITQPLSPLAVSIASKTNVNCRNNSTGSATANAATGGTSPYTYNWTPNGGTNLTASNLTAARYTVTVTDAHNCTATDTVTITQPASILSVTIASDTNVECNGNSTGRAMAYAATGGTSPYTYNWTPNGGTNLSASNLSAATYTITAMDAHGCTATAAVTITQPLSALSISIASQTNENCYGNSTGVAIANNPSGGTSPYIYVWTPNGGTNLTASNLSAGTYTITTTDAHLCTTTTTVTITQPVSVLSISIASQTNVNCYSNSMGSAKANAATGGTSPYTYSWTPTGGTNLTASNLSAGSYTITVTDVQGCVSTASANITQPASAISINITSETNINCYGNSTGSATTSAATGGTPPYTYNWTPNGGTNLTASNLSAGTYIITATDAQNCSENATVTITQPSSPLSLSIISQANLVCKGTSTGSATANAAGGTSPYKYSWSDGETTSSAAGLTAGSYTLTVTDNNGCTATTSVTITQPAKGPVISISSQTNILCFGGVGNATANAASGGDAPYTYSWSPKGGTNLMASNLSAGTYTITANDSIGCMATASVTITQPAALSIIKSSILLDTCEGTAKVTVSGGTTPYTYLWAGGQSIDSIGKLCNGIYCCTITDHNGCNDSACIAILFYTGINNITYSSGISIYPDPNNGQFSIEMENEKPLIEIYNALGQKVYFNYQIIKLSNYQIDLSNQPNGIYLVRILDKDGDLITQKKMVKIQ
jgi:uncharacterized repeat protein (TIGR03803 family)